MYTGNVLLDDLLFKQVSSLLTPSKKISVSLLFPSTLSFIHSISSLWFISLWLIHFPLTSCKKWTITYLLMILCLFSWRFMFFYILFHFVSFIICNWLSTTLYGGFRRKWLTLFSYFRVEGKNEIESYWDSPVESKSLKMPKATPEITQT